MGGPTMRMVPPASDPESELARLRRPPGPWLHQLDAAPADARQLGWMLGQDGVVVRILRGHCARTAYGFFDEVGAALQLPGDPAEDWPGLAALLTDMGWLPGEGHVLVVTRAALLLAAEPQRVLGGLVGAVREIARGRAEEGDPVPFHVVLQDDAVGLAALRERLGAAGAKFDDLTGWYAEEPATEAVAARSSYGAGPVRPDDVDLAAGAAAAEVDGVVEVGRAWEEFRGGAGGAVRVYAPVLTEPRRAAQVAGIVARAVARAGASCVVVPLLADPATRDPRQQAVAAAVTPVWPVPDVPPEPRPAAPARVQAPPVAPERPVPEPVAAPDPVVPAPPAIPEPQPEPAPSEPTPPIAPEPQPEPTPIDPAPRVESVLADEPQPGSVEHEPPVVREPPVAPEPGRVVAAGGGPEEERPGDAPGAEFELVAANLEWAFASGGAEQDAVDAALVVHARTGDRTAGLFRTWVRDPADGWVRVILGYVGPRTSIADVEAERTAVVEILERSGAARCCVEVIAATEAGDVHRWLEERCHPLWPTTQTTTQAADPQPADPQPADPASREAVTAQQAAGQPAAHLPPDAQFSAGPGPDEPVVAGVVAWAEATQGVVGVVSAYAGGDLVLGIAHDGTDPALPVTDALLVPFAPARGLDPVHLRLTRAATRVWHRRAERAAPAAQQRAPQGLSTVAAPQVVALGPPPVRDTADARGDEAIGGFTLLGIDREITFAKGAPQPDERDAKLVEWATAEPTVTALLRATTTVDEETIPIYTIATTEGVNPDSARRALAQAIAATGATRAAAEAFDPAGVIPTFHLDLAVGSTRLWPVRT